MAFGEMGINRREGGHGLLGPGPRSCYSISNSSCILDNLVKKRDKKLSSNIYSIYFLFYSSFASRGCRSPQDKNTEFISSCIPPARPGPNPRPTALPAALAPPARTPLLLPLARAGGVRFVTGEVGRAGGPEEGDLAPVSDAAQLGLGASAKN